MDRFSLIETPLRDSFAQAVRAGLASRPRHVPPRYFYDALGSELFERITRLPEYYLTRTETAILEHYAREFPTAPTVVEFGCGFGAKTRLLFDAFFRARKTMTYVPIDISRRALEEATAPLLRSYPGLSVRAIQAEFEQAFELIPREPSLALFLGSNIGNLDHHDAVRFLSALRGRRALVGFDMQKDEQVLLAAYNDAEGVTAQFNLNLLARINRELGGDFDLAQWDHLAIYDPDASRVEMHLAARRDQEVHVLGETHAFRAGQRIHTENSYKYSMKQIRAIAAESGFRVERVWTDEDEWYAVVLLT
ncbi:MAG: L-histidine N(alpha)-methyltransferase [Planctomycetes bacterium]|nr:L-histidine N(alpha)-methyltransferase [Planctomycetota bacterium]